MLLRLFKLSLNACYLMNCIARFLLPILIVVFLSSAGGAEPLQYNRDIRPILAENCFACHGSDSASREADLRLDLREDAVDFGAIAPNSPEESELIARVVADDPDLLMPPPATKKILSETQKALLKRWIEEGAEYEPHWSFIAPTKPKQPSIGDEGRVRNAIDRFVIARLEKEDLSVAPEADSRTIFRRLHLDILGLPPEPRDVAAFVADYEARKDLALSDWIDRLMESTAWGEHRGRYWLDAARYADTHGLHFDNYREMWPYRDWVIRSFNQNQPFNQFIIEQLAGDLLDEPDEEQLIATGFQRCNITTNEGGTIKEENLAVYAADRVQTFGWVFLGLTTNCAQCHDHKFDPISAQDYYSLSAFFRNTEAPPLDGNVKDGRGPTILIPSREDRPRWEALPGEIANAKSQREERRKLARPGYEKWLATATPGIIADAPSAGLTLHMPLNEGEGDIAHNAFSTDKSYRATGALEWRQGGKFGLAPVIKKKASFELGDVGDFEKDQAFSYGCWIKTTKQSRRQGKNAGIIARMDQNNGHRGWDLWLGGSSLAVHLIDSWDGNALKVSTEQGVIKTDKWQHVFATYTGSGTPDGVKIYVDGKQVPVKVANNTLRQDASIRANTPLRVGQRSNDAVFAGGLVQDVRIYDRLLAADEVMSLASSAHIKSLLAKPAKKRIKAERHELFEYYLTKSDPKYSAFTKVVVDLEGERNKILARTPLTHIQKEKKDSEPMAHVLMRGAYDQLGEKVFAATPAALHPMPADSPRNRLGLAHWTVDAANPLTARVTVNRFWLEVFGQGLVTTPEDFGVMGTLPTHPDLLDWLAVDFVESGWDVKRFFKQIFMSATYRQAAITTPEKLERDPGNFLFSRGPRFRMDAEMVRDTALAVSGLLSPRMYGPGAKPYQPENIWEIVGLPGSDTRTYKQDHGEGLYRRTVYNFWKRMAPPPNMEAFNAPSREVCTIQRERTNTPLQALVTLNDPQFVETARELAENALQASGGDDGMILDYVAERVLSRPLTAKERAITIAAKDDYLGHYRKSADDAKAFISVGESTIDESIDPAVLAAWSMVCNQMMNLDEVLNK